MRLTQIVEPCMSKSTLEFVIDLIVLQISKKHVGLTKKV